MPPSPRIVVIGTSAGGLEALRTLVRGLDSPFPAAICIVMHTAPQSPGILPEILQRSSNLIVATPSNHERIQPGHIYVAPPDQHLVVEPGRLRLTRGPKENRFRPAIDPLFRSAAQVYGPRAIGVVLTGNLDDGTAGLWAIQRLGGTTVVQDPGDALFPSMPRSAMHNVAIDYCVPLADMAPLLNRLATLSAADEKEHAVPDEISIEVDIAKEANAIEAGLEQVSTPSSYACPECHGVLLQLDEGGRKRFRCHTGHAYSAGSLMAAVDHGIDEALWIAVRALEEGGLLFERLSEHVGADDQATRQMQDRAGELRRHSEAIRQLITHRDAAAPVAD